MPRHRGEAEQPVIARREDPSTQLDCQFDIDDSVACLVADNTAYADCTREHPMWRLPKAGHGRRRWQSIVAMNALSSLLEK